MATRKEKNPKDRQPSRNPFNTSGQASPSLESKPEKKPAPFGQKPFGDAARETPETPPEEDAHKPGHRLPVRDPFKTPQQVSPELVPSKPLTREAQIAPAPQARRTPFAPTETETIAGSMPLSPTRTTRWEFPGPPLVEEPSSDDLPQAAFREKPKDTRKRPVVPSFRGIPPALKEQVDRASMDLQAPIGLVARVMIETGLELYRLGDLRLKDKLKLTPGGWTLYPPAKGEVKRPRGRPPASLASGRITPAKGVQKPAPEKNTRYQVAFRGVTTAHRDQLRLISSELMHVPVGEVARAMLENGLQMKKAGTLPSITEGMIEAFISEFGS